MQKVTDAMNDLLHSANAKQLPAWIVDPTDACQGLSQMIAQPRTSLPTAHHILHDQQLPPYLFTYEAVKDCLD